MKKSEVIQAWSKILGGRPPSLSIEITKECPLQCPRVLRIWMRRISRRFDSTASIFSDFQGRHQLVSRVLALIDEHKPLHVSLVGGDPLVRYRELELLLPEIEKRGVHTQIVTSAFRVIPANWAAFKKIGMSWYRSTGLQPEHDARRKPATYEPASSRTLKVRTEITAHCTITSQIAGRPGYLDEFLEFWSGRPEIVKVWFSLFTPQRGAADPEILTPPQRATVIADLRRLRVAYPILDMPEPLIREMESPPSSPTECIFARTTHTISADLKTKITPCQFGGDPDCGQCGCIASMALAAVGHHPVLGGLTAGQIFIASERVGEGLKIMRRKFARETPLHSGSSPLNKEQLITSIGKMRDSNT